MSTSVALQIAVAPGGSFLLDSRTPAEVFTPEDINEEQRQFAATAARFAREEILPATAAIEAKEPGVMASQLRKAAELGFTAVDVPEEFGGLELDKVSSTLITDHISILASFATAFGAHIGIASLPLIWYGTEEQKQRYLPKLATCEWIGWDRVMFSTDYPHWDQDDPRYAFKAPLTEQHKRLVFRENALSFYGLE